MRQPASGHVSSDPRDPNYLLYIGDEKLPSYIGIIVISHEIRIRMNRFFCSTMKCHVMVTIVLNITSLCFWLVVMGSIFRPTISPRHLVRCSFGFLADGQGWKTLGIRGTIDGRNPANQLRLVVYPTIYRVFLHPRW